MLEKLDFAGVISRLLDEVMILPVTIVDLSLYYPITGVRFRLLGFSFSQ